MSAGDKRGSPRLYGFGLADLNWKRHSNPLIGVGAFGLTEAAKRLYQLLLESPVYDCKPSGFIDKNE